MKTPPLQPAFAAVFGRIFLVVFTTQQFIAFQKTRHMFRGAGPASRLYAFFDFTPYALVLALFVAGCVTVAIDLAVRWLLRPIAGRWYNPLGSGAAKAPLAFHLALDEKVRAECPARTASARGWRPGTLVLTDKRLVFFSLDWDVEPWSVSLARLASLRVEPTRAVLGSLLLGVPGRLIARDSDGAERAFAVVEPTDVFAWFTRPDVLGGSTHRPILIDDRTTLPRDRTARAPLVLKI